MARIIDNQVNTWGKQQGADPQRTDLWVVDFTRALTGLDSTSSDATQMSSGNRVPYVPPKLATYFSSSVTLPELRVRAEPVKRDSRPYQMPSWDDPIEAIRMVFILDCFRAGQPALSPYRSDIYQMLDVWRACVRAGRGSMSSEFAIALDGNYRIEYAFDVAVRLLRPSSNPTGQGQATATKFVANEILNDLEYSMQFRLVNCWLSSFKLTELNYDAAKVAQIEAIFYAEDIKQETSANH